MSVDRECERLKKRLKCADSSRFSNITLLGEGGHAYTFRAYDSSGNHDVAIKVPKKGEVADIIEEGFRVAFLCPHVNIVEVFGPLRYEGHKRALVMEYIDGSTLRQLIGQVKGDVKTALKIAIDICKALQRAHEYTTPIVHRDVKPENILISSSNERDFWGGAIAKLADFGIAIDMNTQDPEVIGSLPYMAPEQINGGPPDFRWDLYAAVVVLYEMLQGVQPFVGETIELIKRITNQLAPPLKRSVPAGLKRIVYKGLAKNPAERYQTASELLCDLEVFQNFSSLMEKVSKEFKKRLKRTYSSSKSRWKLSEMFADESISMLSQLQASPESDSYSSNAEFRLALLHGAVEEYDEAEIAIREIQRIDPLTPGHPFNVEHAFIKRFTSSRKETPAAPMDAAPMDAAPMDAAPMDAAPTDAAPMDAVPMEAAPDKKIDQFAIRVAEVKQLLAEDMFEKARGKSKAILETAPNAEVYLDLCDLFSNAGVMDHVLELCESGLRLHENCAGLHAHLGKTLFGKEPRRSLEAMEKAMALGCTDPELADLLDDLNR